MRKPSSPLALVFIISLLAPLLLLLVLPEVVIAARTSSEEDKFHQLSVAIHMVEGWRKELDRMRNGPMRPHLRWEISNSKYLFENFLDTHYKDSHSGEALSLALDDFFSTDLCNEIEVERMKYSGLKDEIRNLQMQIVRPAKQSTSKQLGQKELEEEEEKMKDLKLKVLLETREAEAKKKMEELKVSLRNKMISIEKALTELEENKKQIVVCGGRHSATGSGGEEGDEQNASAIAGGSGAASAHDHHHRQLG